MSIHFRLVILGTLLAPATLVLATPGPIHFKPSNRWIGVDGNWSSISLFLGQPDSQEIHVTVSTSLSEIYAVDTDGCDETSTSCPDARGGLYNPAKSSNRTSLGSWQLGLRNFGLGGNGDYGLDQVTIPGNTLGRQVVVALNDTEYYDGFFGLGMEPGHHDGRDGILSPIGALVEQYGIIESHSYGFTAGAYYAGSAGVPLSLTLGGYDKNRFEAHQTTFALNSNTKRPETRIKSISASVADASLAPTKWDSSSMSLSLFNESTVATIDSSTPFLWLPAAVCDRFASALNLTWDSDLQLYTFGKGEALDHFRASTGLSFTFSLSDAQDDTGSDQPLSDPGVVNITLPAKAFDHVLSYPFQDAVEKDASPMPYFPLRRVENDGPIVIGRAFLQEAYLITNYETGTFSVSQAKFPENDDNTAIESIAFSPASPYPGPPKPDQPQYHISKGALAGIIVALCAVLVTITTGIWYWRHKKTKVNQKTASRDASDEFKDDGSVAESLSPQSPVVRLFTRFADSYPSKATKGGNDREPRRPKGEVLRNTTEDRGGIEMSPITKSTGLDGSLGGATIDFKTIGSETTWDMTNAQADASSLYETERQHMDRQHKGRMPSCSLIPPSPEEVVVNQGQPFATPYSAGSSYMTQPTHQPPENNTAWQAPNHAQGSLNSDMVSDMVSTMPTHVHRSLTHSAVSPANTGLTSRITDFHGLDPFAPGFSFFQSDSPRHSPLNTPRHSPSPSINLKRHSTTQTPSSNRRRSRSFSAGSSLAFPLPSYQRVDSGSEIGPIDGANIVCLGPLTENIRRQYETARIHQQLMSSNNGQAFTLPTVPSGLASNRHSMAETLGSNFTIEEDARTAQAHVDEAGVMSRFDDIIHIPQIPERRYSWEAEQ